MLVRRGLHAVGRRFRVQRSDLAGKPDVVFSRYQVVIFVLGYFWHGHGCPKFMWPRRNPNYRKKKIVGNREPDRAAIDALLCAKWCMVVVGECAIVGL